MQQKDARKVNSAIKKLKASADKEHKGFYAGSQRYIFDASLLVKERIFSMSYWIKWGYRDEEVIALINFYNEIAPIKSLLLRYEEGGSLEYGEYIYSAGTLSCRELPVEHYPDATDSDSDQEHLQQAFERYGTTREIPFS